MREIWIFLEIGAATFKKGCSYKTNTLDFKIFSFWFTEHLLLRCLRTKVSWSGFILLRSVYIFPWKAQLKKWICADRKLLKGFLKINRKSMVSVEKLQDLLTPNGKSWGEKVFWHSNLDFGFLVFLSVRKLVESVLDACFIFRKQINDFFETK